MSFQHKEIEKKWQTYWLENKTFATLDHNEKQKFYALDMFPYPSGADCTSAILKDIQRQISCPV